MKPSPAHLAQWKAEGFVEMRRTMQGELWGAKLIKGRPVWHRVGAQSQPVNEQGNKS